MSSNQKVPQIPNQQKSDDSLNHSVFDKSEKDKAGKEEKEEKLEMDEGEDKVD